MSTHLHKYKFSSEVSKGHKHNIYGRTDYMIGINYFHFHYYCEISSYCGHTHYFSGITGLPIKTKNGHIHKIEGILEFNNNHQHKYSNYTFEDIESLTQKKISQSYV
jgi:hypothetical protein